MASIQLGSSSAWTEQQWAAAVEIETQRQTPCYAFVKDDPNATFLLREDLSKGKGESITYKFSPWTESDGISSGESVFANAKQVDTFDDSVSIDWLGFSYGLDNPMDQQRTASDLKKMIFQHARDDWKARWETVFCNHMGGNTVANTRAINPGSVGAFKHVGHNAVTAYDANHLFYAGSGNSSDADVAADPNATFNLGLIIEWEEAAMSKSYLQYPIAPGPDGYYDCVIHPMNWRQLYENSTAGEWQALQVAQLQGGQKWEKNKLAQGYLGHYSKTRIHVSDYVPQGITGGAAQAKTRRPFFLGRMSGCMAFGGGYASGTHLDWTEQVVEHKDWSLLVDSIFGFKATLFDNGSGTDEYYGSLCTSVYTPV